MRGFTTAKRLSRNSALADPCLKASGFEAHAKLHLDAVEKICKASECLHSQSAEYSSLWVSQWDDEEIKGLHCVKFLKPNIERIESYLQQKKAAQLQCSSQIENASDNFGDQMLQECLNELKQALVEPSSGGGNSGSGGGNGGGQESCDCPCDPSNTYKGCFLPIPA
jgi:hypothetical protein